MADLPTRLLPRPLPPPLLHQPAYLLPAYLSPVMSCLPCPMHATISTSSLSVYFFYYTSQQRSIEKATNPNDF